MARAIEAGHPRNLDQYVDPQIKDMFEANFKAAPAELAKKRVEFFKKYLERATEPKPEEDKLRAKMPEHVLDLVGNKRLVLWKEILTDLGYPDSTIVDEIASGFRLSGWMPRSSSHGLRGRPCPWTP